MQSLYDTDENRGLKKGKLRIKLNKILSSRGEASFEEFYAGVL